ncbi:MAG: hypothetical protein JWM16_4971 [Verrucomicrobiales bacterium]|nr:hypothetical protein [Verrucomicrobiales bacterium]
MTLPEAKRILLLYRPHSVESDNRELAQALELARQDDELREWFEAHCAFQKTVHQKLCQLPVPADLKERILSERKIIQVHWWQHPGWLAAAAAILLLAAFGPMLFSRERLDKFDDYRNRMVGSALRHYGMEIVTNNLEQVRQFMVQHGSPADYQVPKPLTQLKVTGGGRLEWRSNPVSMVCFDRGSGQMLFLFVMNQAAVKDAPSRPAPELKQVSKLATASWTKGGKTYLLAGEGELAALQSYLPGI